MRAFLLRARLRERGRSWRVRLERVPQAGQPCSDCSRPHEQGRAASRDPTSVRLRTSCVTDTASACYIRAPKERPHRSCPGVLQGEAAAGFARATLWGAAAWDHSAAEDVVAA